MRKNIIVIIWSFLCIMPIHAQEFNFTKTGLPVCYITTADNTPIESKNEYVPATIRIERDNETILSESAISIRLRGNATITYPKKPYKIKFNKKTVPLPGMSKDKSFALLANFTDRSLMNVAIGFKIGSMLENGWVPQSQFVEVVVNGEHLGTYQLTEDVKRSTERVNIADTGFLIEFDFDYASSVHYFFTQHNEWAFTFKYPDDDDVTETEISYVEDFMNRFEEALYADDFKVTRSYTNLIDEESFAKWYYQKNLLMMEECNRYFVKDDNTDQTTLKMGPLWDFEWCLGNFRDHVPAIHYLENKLYFKRMCTDPEFMKRVALVHQKYGAAIYSEILDFYDVLSDSLQRSQALNFQLWDLLGKPIAYSYVGFDTWEEEVQYSKNFFITHYRWLEEQLKPYLSGDGITETVCRDYHQEDGIFAIDGRRLFTAPQQNGLYIRNGRKYLIR